MLPFFSERFGNAASRTHAFGWEAARAVERARQQVAQLLGATAGEIVFTSGATEANNLAIKGAARAARDRGDHIVTVVTEHSSVLEPCRRLEREGFRVTWLPVERDGIEVKMSREMKTDPGGDGTWDSLREGHNHTIAPNFTSIRMFMAKGERWHG